MFWALENKADLTFKKMFKGIQQAQNLRFDSAHLASLNPSILNYLTFKL